MPQRREIKKIAKSRLADHGLPFSTWSLSKLTEFLVAEGVIDDISHEGLRALLREGGVTFQRLKPGRPPLPNSFNASLDSNLRSRLRRGLLCTPLTRRNELPHTMIGGVSGATAWSRPLRRNGVSSSRVRRFMATPIRSWLSSSALRRRGVTVPLAPVGRSAEQWCRRSGEVDGPTSRCRIRRWVAPTPTRRRSGVLAR